MPLSKNISVFLTLNTKQFQSQISRTTKSMKAFGASMQSIGSSITRNFSVPFALLGGYAAKTALDFDKSMTKIRTLVGISASEVSKFSDEVRNLATQTGVSANELAEALFDITSAGLRGDDALAALEMSAKSTAIGLGETKSVASALSGVLNAYADTNLTAAQAADVLLKTVREGKLEAETLAPVLGRVTPLAATLGVTFEEVGASIATFTKLGVSAEEAATGLRGVLSALIKPTSQAKLALKSYGLSIEDVRKMVGERGLMLTLQHLMHTFGDNEEAISSLFGNVRALTTVLGTAGTQAETYEQVLQSLTNSQGALNEAFEIVEETASFKLNQAFQELKDALIELGAALVPVILQFSEWIKKLVAKWKELNPETKEFITQLAVAFAVGGPILMGVGSLVTMLSGVGGSFAKFLMNNPKLALMAGILALIVYYWDEVKVAIANASNQFIDFYNNTIEFRAVIWGIMGLIAQMVQIVVTVFEVAVSVIEFLANKIKNVWENTLSRAKNLTEAPAEEKIYAGLMMDPRLAIGNKLMGQAFGFNLESMLFGEEGPSYKKDDKVDTSGTDFFSDLGDIFSDFHDNSENIWDKVMDNVEDGKIDKTVTPEDIQKPFDEAGDFIKNMFTDLFGEMTSFFGMDGMYDEAFGGGDTPTDAAPATTDDVVLGLDLEEQESRFQLFVDNISSAWAEGVNIMAQEFENFAVRFGDGMSEALSTAIVEGESMKEAFKGFMKQMTQEVLKMIIKTLVLRTIMQALGLPVGSMSLGAGLDAMSGVTPVGDVAFGPSQGRYIVGPEGAFSLSPRDSIIAGTDLFGGQQGASHMTVNGYIDGSSIMLSNQRETNTTNRLS